MDADRITAITGLKLDIHPSDHGTVVQLTGELDVGSSRPLQDILLRIMRDRNPRLLLDLCGVSFMDCSGLTALILTQRRAVQRHGWVRLIAVSEQVRKVIVLTGLADVLTLPSAATPVAHAG
jgi:anti-sigma B factor antagonist